MEKKIDVTALGEILIDFTSCGESEAGQRVFEQNPGEAPANVLACLNKCGKKTAFIGKVGNDMHGQFLFDVISEEVSDTILRYVFCWNTTRRTIGCSFCSSSFAQKVKEAALAGELFYEAFGIIPISEI